MKKTSAPPSSKARGRGETHLLNFGLLLLDDLVLLSLDRLLLLHDGLNRSSNLDRLARVPRKVVLDPERRKLRALGLLALKETLLDRLLLLVRLGLRGARNQFLVCSARERGGGRKRTAARLTRSARPLGTGLKVLLAPIQSLG